ncbi:MAG: hypothetical protein ACREA0_14950, partial [bacterium]
MALLLSLGRRLGSRVRVSGRGGGGPHPRLQLNPDRVSLRVNINGPGDPLVLEDVDLASQGMHAYGRLLVEVL